MQTNNFISDTIIATHLNEYFGFTDQEVKDILKDIGLQEHFKEIKEWYDGYNFGEIDVYCPWDVMNYVRDLRINPDMKPASYWKNTSDNAIIRSFIDYAGSGIQKKMEKLMAGDTIDQKIEENLTYDYLHSSEENFWSILYLTGYLTRDKEEKESADGKITLKIPNKEILFIMHFLQEYLLGLDIVLNRIKNMEKVEVILLFLMNMKERLQFLKRNIQKK